MQKQYNIKWRKIDQVNLRRAVKNYNAKRARLIKKNPVIEEFLPPKASTVTIKKELTTRRDFDNKIKSLQRFSRPNAEKIVVNPQGVAITQYEKTEATIKLRAINRYRFEARKRADVSTEKGTMGTIRANNLAPKKFNFKGMSEKDWGKFVESVDKQSTLRYRIETDERYKENYITALWNVFGMEGAVAVELVRQIPAPVLVNAYYSNPLLSIDYVYGAKERAEKLKVIERELRALLWLGGVKNWVDGRFRNHNRSE